MSGVPAYEARVMKHPHARKGVIHAIKGLDPVSGRPFTDSHGDPDVFPDVTVKDETTEAYYRSRGYLFAGEVPPPPAEYSEYPVMLIHPEHVEAVPDDFSVEKGDHGEVIRHRIPGSPEKYPPRQANNAADEADLAKKGYARSGSDNPDAVERAKASPYNPTLHHQEFPKLVDGVMIDPGAPVGGPQQYPKWVGDKVVNNADEERALTGSVTPPPPQSCVICGDPITEDDRAGRGPKGPYHLAHVASTSKDRISKMVETKARKKAEREASAKAQ